MPMLNQLSRELAPDAPMAEGGGVSMRVIAEGQRVAWA